MSNKLHESVGGKQVVTRFAPSPTGKLHIGGLRTALFCYLFAKKHGGRFILRIEDTDRNRFDPEAEDYIQNSLEWVGMIPDESPWVGGPNGPYRQSERDYSGHIKFLLDNDFAYRAFDTPEELGMARQEDKWFSYAGENRQKMRNDLSLGKEEGDRLVADGVPFVVRFKMPDNEDVSFTDIIRDKVTQNTSQLDDKVIVKSDGIPTYHLANVCDDHDMEVTHVIRGEEWISSTPLHVLLYKAFGWDIPEFAHLPLILNPDGKGKLSKRTALRLGFPVLPVGGDGTDHKGREVVYKGFKDDGYYPDALINFLLLLGWSPGEGDREFFTMEEAIDAFSLEGVNKSGARFTIDKAKWFNQQYLQNKDADDLKHHIDLGDTFTYDDERMSVILDLAKKRSTFPQEMNAVTDIFFKPVVLSQAEKDKTTDDFKTVMPMFVDKADEIDWDDANDIKQMIYELSKETKSRMGAVMRPLRQAIADGVSGPDLATTMYVLGKDECLTRINAMLN